LANIMINTVCNLNCPYCFASEFVINSDDKDNLNHVNNISVENYKKAIDFILKDKSSDRYERLGIIGGEPTLHPQFKELIEIALYNECIDKINVFTNGIELHRHFNLLSNPKITLLVNLNSPEDVGRDRYDTIINNLDFMFREMYMDVGQKMELGINIYSPDMNWQHMVDALVKYGLRSVRVAIAVPHIKDRQQINALDYFRSLKPTVFSFFRALERHDIMPVYDCNLMPVCLISPSEEKWLKKFWKLEQRTNKYCNVLDGPVCSPVIDILPDLRAVRCFGCSDQEKVFIGDFNNLGEVEGYFKRKYDAYAYSVYNSLKCRHCSRAKKGLCTGGCLSFKIEKINQAAALVEGIA